METREKDGKMTEQVMIKKGEKISDDEREIMKRVLSEPANEVLEMLEQYDVLMMRYDSAIREVRTKLEVLNDELSLTSAQSPISSIQSRRKKTASIIDKLKKLDKELTIESIIANLNDVAGIRVICRFVDDIYKIARMLARQDDIKLIEVKDYIKNPKPNGYRSYHMIVEVPVFFASGKVLMRVEVQIRTIAMDFWANLEHQMKYKQDIEEADVIMAELKECADTIADTDLRMLSIRDKIKDVKTKAN